MKIALEALPNIDFRGDDRSVKLRSVEVKDIYEAKTVLNNFIVDNDLGAGNFTERTGKVCDDKGRRLAYISYNLRVWDLDGKELV